jgi:endonuclease/exonuclease/phosphatase family metal-dependent hydrolase
LRDVRLVPLIFPHVDERGAICADAEIDGKTLRVAATHLGLPPFARKKQLQTILAHCDPGSARPFALIGDLNRAEPYAELPVALAPDGV